MIGLPKQAVGSFTNGLSGPKIFRDFRETGPRTLQLQYLVKVTAFSQTKLFSDEFLNKIWLEGVTILILMQDLRFIAGKVWYRGKIKNLVYRTPFHK